jgi:hypothetical protein
MLITKLEETPKLTSSVLGSFAADSPRKLSDYGEGSRDVPKTQCHEDSLGAKADKNCAWSYWRWMQS